MVACEADSIFTVFNEPSSLTYSIPVNVTVQSLSAFNVTSCSVSSIVTVALTSVVPSGISEAEITMFSVPL